MKTLLLLFALATLAGAAPQAIDLWPEGVPGLKPDAGPEKLVDGRTTNIHHPSLLVFPAEKPNGSAVVLCSGGGYVRISVNPQGDSSTRLLNRLGITVFALKYRLSDYGHPAPLQDVLRAVRTVRSRAAEFGVDSRRIGVMGTSAGGHLSACAATLWDHAAGKTGAALDAVSARPDFAVLVYPVVSMAQPFAHAGSRDALLGTSPAAATAALLSVETQVRKDTPPIFIAATMADTVVPVENSLAFYQSLVKAGVPSELHIYPHGDHGNSLDPRHGPTATWPARLEDWLRFQGLLGTNR
jgi:acetyl esterase/lipase